MLGNLTGFAFVSLLSLGSYAGSFVIPHQKSHLISPLPTNKIVRVAYHPTTTPTPTSTPTPLPTATPTPLPTDTPTPTATPTPIVTSGDLETLFSKYAGEQSVDKELLKKIARCESGFNSEASFMDYLGMFQFSPDSWIATRHMMNADPNPDLRKNPEEAIKTAAFKIAHGGQNAWPNCSH